MSKILFSILLLIHGMIHLMGFLKAFQLAEISELKLPISRHVGVFWLITVLIFLVALGQYLLKNGYWWMPAMAGILLSQVLVILFWQDAKFGTIANVLILAVALTGMASRGFQQKIERETTALFQAATIRDSHIVKSEDMVHLPAPVQKWLRHTGIIGKENISSVRLKQHAQMKMKPEQEYWTDAIARQYFTIDPPAFLWEVEMKMMSVLPISGRDLFINGRGEMMIKLLSAINVVNAQGDKIDQGTIQRYLGEIVWFPSAALSPYIQWEDIDEHSAKATLNYKGKSAAGTFSFTKAGDLKQYSAMRYMNDDPDPKEWIVTAKETSEINGIRIPVKLDATWKLETGDWTWLQIEIETIEYNFTETDRQ